MTTRADLATYLRCLADLMGLRDWTVSVGPEPPDDREASAEIECVYGRKLLVVSVPNRFFAGKDHEQRHTVCHELTHALFAQMNQFCYQEFGEGQYKTWKFLMEYGIDAVADVLAPFLPFPFSFPKESPMAKKPQAPKSSAKPSKSTAKPMPKGKGGKKAC